MGRRIALSVSQLNEYVRRLFQQDPLLCEVELKGEISNLKRHQTGTVFFSLKDELASISCVMYVQDVYSLQVEPFDGMRAAVVGSVGLYARGGQYQFYVKEIKPQGMGVLFERYQLLKERLEHEGLFRNDTKKAIPGYIDTVGVVSSPTGAVIHDILSVSLRRNSESSILLCPVRVQGAEAADEVIAAIRMLEQLEHVSVIIVARGGGSIEDLWTFNEERVVRAVAACKKPIVSAIGHETDFTLCDFAADLRAPTPSAAAECVVPLRDDMLRRLAALKEDLISSADYSISQRKYKLEMVKARLKSQHPARNLDERTARLRLLAEGLRNAALLRMDKIGDLLNARARELKILSPYQVLERGYSIVTRNGMPITSVMDVKSDEELSVMMKDGTVNVKVLGKKQTDSLLNEV